MGAYAGGRRRGRALRACNRINRSPMSGQVRSRRFDDTIVRAECALAL